MFIFIEYSDSQDCPKVRVRNEGDTQHLLSQIRSAPADFIIPKEDEEGDSYITVSRSDSGWVIDPAESTQRIETSAPISEVAVVLFALITRHREVVEIEDDLTLLPSTSSSPMSIITEDC